MKAKVLFLGALLAMSLGTAGMSEGMDAASIEQHFNVNPNPTPKNNRFFLDSNECSQNLADQWNKMQKSDRWWMHVSMANVGLLLSQLANCTRMDSDPTNGVVRVVHPDPSNPFYLMVRCSCLISNLYRCCKDKDMNDEDARNLQNWRTCLVDEYMGLKNKANTIKKNLVLAAILAELQMQLRATEKVLEWITNVENENENLARHREFWTSLEHLHVRARDTMRWVAENASSILSFNVSFETFLEWIFQVYHLGSFYTELDRLDCVKDNNNKQEFVWLAERYQLRCIALVVEGKKRMAAQGITGLVVSFQESFEDMLRRFNVADILSYKDHQSLLTQYFPGLTFYDIMSLDTEEEEAEHANEK